MKKIQSTRREYGNNELLEKNISQDPLLQFDKWLDEAINIGMLDASAMVLATVDEKGWPETRVVLLKTFDQRGFVFFTHYNSPKAIQAEKVGVVALNFYWRELSKQIRIRGNIERISREESEIYFSSRPRGSQLSTHASNQSAIISSREVLEKAIVDLTKQHEGNDVPCPTSWGGYRVIPFEYEFFQGRNDRLNDRIRYRLIDKQWKIERLSP